MELGNYAFDISYLFDLEKDIEPLLSFNVPTDFDPSVIAAVQNWLNTEVSKITFIYGEDDPWTLATIKHPNKNDLIAVVHP